jgi:hypothetical protein
MQYHYDVTTRTRNKSDACPMHWDSRIVSCAESDTSCRVTGIRLRSDLIKPDPCSTQSQVELIGSWRWTNTRLLRALTAQLALKQTRPALPQNPPSSCSTKEAVEVKPGQTWSSLVKPDPCFTQPHVNQTGGWR